jgi:hypothetical protein
MAEPASASKSGWHLVWIAAVAALAVDVTKALLAKVNFKLPKFGTPVAGS